MQKNTHSIHQIVTSFLDYFHSSSFKHSDRAAITYIGLLFLGLTAYMMSSPIIVTDTDMWYHLNGGRYFWETGTVSSSTFFSFIEPEKYRTNYFWGFQALSFKIYDLFGYQGLIVLKTSLVLVSGFFVSKIILGENKFKAANIFQLLVIALAIYLISLRGNIVRPHLISYALIPIFIYILLHRPKYIFALPVLTVIWANFHGVEWPVGALISGAFFLQFIQNFRETGDKKYITYALWTLSCLPAILVNPYGYNIFLAPFSIDPDTYLFISELKETTIFTSTLITDYPSISQGGIIFLLFTISLYAIFMLWIKQKLTLVHVLLSIGAMTLLFKGQRFIWEWLFLSTPLFWSACTLIFENNPIKHKHATISFIVSLALISPFAIWAKKSFTFNDYPYDYTQSPTPTTEFIKQLGVKGKYMAPASLAGYIQWELYPDLLIHSDMEFPPFSGIDFLESLKSMTSETGLAHVIEKYNPDYFGVYLSVTQFPDFVEATDTFTLISFDDHLALYINKKKHPELAAKHEIKHINPFNIYSSVHEDDLSPYIKELQALIKFNKHSETTLTALISYLIVNKQYTEALEYINVLKNTYATNPNVLFLQGQAHENLRQYEQAIQTYTEALSGPTNTLHKVMHTYLADSHYQMENYSEAYKHYKYDFNPFLKNESPKRYYAFSYSALIVGDVKRAKRLLTYMLMQYSADAESAEIIDNAKTLLKRIENNQFKSSFIL